MISPAQALEIVLSHAHTLPGSRVALVDARGSVLAREVRADRDLPPFDRAAVDGFAVRLAQPWNEEGQEFRVRGMVAAGDRFRGKWGPGDAVQIMTGAPVPGGADGVIMVERSHRVSDRVVRLGGAFDSLTRPGLAPRGQDARRGDPLVFAGTRLGPTQLAILASVGSVQPTVCGRASVMLVSTGDEIVEPHHRPGPAQIRNSNATLLQSMLHGSGWVRDVRLRRAGDRPASIRRALARGKTPPPDVFVFTGGVSMGEFDLVPDLLREAGFEIHFHRIALRPGKPLLFGTRGRGRTRQAVFGLPGNPVSVTVTAWEFLLPFLRACAGSAEPEPLALPVRARVGIERKPGLTHFVPARLGPSGQDVEPVVYHGSGDFVALGWADCLVRLESDHPRVQAGDLACVHPLFREREIFAPGPTASRATGEESRS